MARPSSPLKIPSDLEPSDEAFEAVTNDLINDVILEYCYQVHWASKIGIYKIDNADDEEDVSRVEDIYGHVKGKHKIPFNCPNCQKMIEASKFASHLETCMTGRGRKSSRVARRKLDALDESDIDDDENSDSSYSSSKKKVRKKAGKGAAKKRIAKDLSGLSALEGSSMAASAAGGYHMSYENYKLFLDQYCGVESKHTRKMCMNTLNCSAHSNSQKTDIRNKLLSPEQKTDDVQIDVDTVDGESSIFTNQNLYRDSSPGNSYSGDEMNCSTNA